MFIKIIIIQGKVFVIYYVSRAFYILNTMPSSLYTLLYINLTTAIFMERAVLILNLRDG